MIIGVARMQYFMVTTWLPTRKMIQRCHAEPRVFLLFLPLRWGWHHSQLAEITKRKFDPQTLAAAVLAVAGVGFLELAGSQQFVIGTGIHRVSWRFGGPQVLSKRNIILNTKQGGSSLKTSRDMQTNLDHPWIGQVTSFPLRSP